MELTNYEIKVINMLFDSIFTIDYETMFDKLIISPLKGFMEATKFRKVDPRKQVVFDIFEL